MGPFQFQDLAEYGVAVALSKDIYTAFPDRTFRSPIGDLLLKSGRNGYYIYANGNKPKADPEVLPTFEESRRLVNMMPGRKHISVSDQEIVEMVMFLVVNEDCRVLEEEVVVRASD
ncbi:peroxisomal fatty acid beta-oxidation multifunctional protein AIM1-like [Rutidosis leptorrhynchoides]|uniref:peroxisomal fatty acid beta-oxidation multifunctional protein AIM1-like n=1 Tax=Rutidosis leptorrhynchoides TaxID=125765 RepID=UPI003A99C6EA